MFDPDMMIPTTSSPTASSSSSSDLDTQSTGSFFHDRSRSLGALMGVSFPTVSFQTPSQSQARVASATYSIAGRGLRGGKKSSASAADKRRRWWWSLCREDDSDAKPGSLGEFLEVERRFGDVGPRLLFADGRVLPPVARVEESPSHATVLCPFPITGICRGHIDTYQTE